MEHRPRKSNQSRIKRPYLGQMPIFSDGKHIQTSTSIRIAGINEPSRWIQGDAPCWVEKSIADGCDLRKRSSDWVLFVGGDCPVSAADPLVVHRAEPRYKNKPGIAYYAVWTRRGGKGRVRKRT